MKKICVMVPTYNEEDSVEVAYGRIKNVMEQNLADYDFELVFIDNYSTDRTRELIRELCKKDARVKAIFNAKNFGYARSLFYGLTQMTADVVMLIHADLQNPPELIPEFVKKWENGAKVVIGIKNESKENHLMYFIRGIYYKLMNKMCEVEQIEQFSDYELLDKSFIEVLRKIDDPMPYLRGIITELGFNIEKVYYTQDKRREGKSHASLLFLYDYAMLGFTSYSKAAMRFATFIGSFFAFGGFVIAIVTFILKLLRKSNFPTGTAAIICGVFFLGGLILFVLGMIGEYIANINIRTMRRPLVIEEERIGYPPPPSRKHLSLTIIHPSRCLNTVIGLNRSTISAKTFFFEEVAA